MPGAEAYKFKIFAFGVKARDYIFEVIAVRICVQFCGMLL